MKIMYLKAMESWKEAVNGKICKWNLWIKIIEYKFRKLFNIPVKNKIYLNRIKCVLPYTYEEIVNKGKFIKKLKNIQGIVLDKELSKNEEICAKIQQNNIYIYDGKWLFKYFIIETLEYICKNINIDMSNIGIAILTKETTDETIQTILKVVNRVKNISIVTSQINKFCKIEEMLYKEMGIPIKISNNKKKSLRKEKIIINMDMDEKELKLYNILQDAIIINIKNNIYNINKSFRGININNFEIVNTKYHIEGFDEKNVYESYIYRKDTYDNIKQQLNEERIKIRYLIGKRGIIQEKEYKEFYKNY